MIINTNEDIFTKCMVGNVISGSIYIFMFGCFFWAMVNCCTNFCGLFKKPFNNATMLSCINPIFALIFVCCGALFTAAVYRDADCATKCMFGNVLSVVSLLLIIFIISCGNAVVVTPQLGLTMKKEPCMFNFLPVLLPIKN